MLCTIHALVIWKRGGGGGGLLQKVLMVSTDMGRGRGPLQTVGTSSPHSSYESLLDNSCSWSSITLGASFEVCLNTSLAIISKALHNEH